MSAKHIVRLIALIASVAIGMSAVASEFKMGNYDLEGSRSIKGKHKGKGKDKLTKKNVEKHGLEVKWITMTDGSVTGSPVTSGKKVMVGDMNGNMYAFDAKDGSLVWKTCLEASCAANGFPFAGIIGSPLVKGKTVYVGTLSGSLVALKIKTGEVLWIHTPLVNPLAFGFIPLDAIWGGPIAVADMIVYGLAPSDQFGFGVDARGAVLAVDRKTGAEIWRSVLISDADFLAGSTGAPVWGTTPTYSKKLGLIYVSTGQDRNPMGGAAGSDSIFAIDATDGTIIWQTQVRTTNTWNVTLPFDPLAPVDTDFGQSPSVFKVKGKTMVAAGDKRGIFWVMDAHSGAILNNGGAGLDLFGGVLPGPGLTGGFNLDAGFVQRGKNVKHFAVFADQSAALQDVVDMVPPWTSGVCFIGPPGPVCPTLPTGSVVILEGDGSAEVCRFSVPGTEMFSPFHMDGMILVRGAQIGKLYVIDFDDCGLIDMIAVPTGPSGGAAISISDGLVFTGGGFFGAPGLTAIGIAK